MLLVLKGFIGIITRNAAAKHHSVKNVYAISISTKVYTNKEKQSIGIFSPFQKFSKLGIKFRNIPFYP
jgi:hypothetical protein